MAIDLCFYFQVHQPWRLRPYKFLEVGKSHHYFDDELNASIMRRVTNKCYLPMNNLLSELLSEYPGNFKIAFSISGTAMQQMELYAPEALLSFRRLCAQGNVEILSETAYHSLAALHSPAEFREQVAMHRELVREHLGVEPSRVFRNTELVTSNEIVRQVAELGYEGMLMEGADHVLHWRSPLFKYRMAAAPNMVGLLKNYRLSDDIAFRFSDRAWAQWPLTSEKFTQWVKLLEPQSAVGQKGANPFLGLFMDYETFGEHQWASTGIFDFFRALPARLLATEGLSFVTPSEAVAQARSETFADGKPEYLIDAPEPFSWADVERDLSAWEGNQIQDSAIATIYALEATVKKLAADDRVPYAQDLLETWRRLTSSDHFYYMCTKYFADGDVHQYFNPYDTPYDAYIAFMNVIADFENQMKSLGYVEKESVA